jgi:hypothetical protein
MIPTSRIRHEAEPDSHGRHPNDPPDGRSNLAQVSSLEAVSTPNRPAMSTRRRQRDISADPADTEDAPLAKKIKGEIESSDPVFKTGAAPEALPERMPAAQGITPAQLIRAGGLQNLRAYLQAGPCEPQAKALLLQQAAFVGWLEGFDLLLEFGAMADYRRLQAGHLGQPKPILFQAAVLGQNPALLDRLNQVDCPIADRSRDELKHAILLAASKGGKPLLERLCSAADSANIRWEPADMSDYFDAAVQMPKHSSHSWGNPTRGCIVMAYLTKRYPDRFNNSVYSRPLSSAVKSNNWEAAAQLLGAYGANARLTDSKGISLLMRAAFAGKFAMYELLRFHDASPHALDHNGNSVLHYAARGGSAAIVKDLVMKCKVSTNTTNHQGETALDLAQPATADQIAWILKQS